METKTSVDTLEAALPAPPPATDALVDVWFVDWCCNQGFGVDLYNRLFRAKEDLKARLSGRKE